MAEFHFVEDYVRYVDELVAAHPIDEAMSLAVGGSYDQIGGIEADILQHMGLTDGHSLLDLGCGSGRLAVALAIRLDISYEGLDVVPALLDYAGTRCPAHYRFTLNRTLKVPVKDASLDMACAFSVFTHLLHGETYLYLEEMYRALKEGGKVVASFLEFHMESHWAVFDTTLAELRKGNAAHLNQFIERDALSAWATRIGFREVEIIRGDMAPWSSGEALGQSIAVLTK